MACLLDCEVLEDVCCTERFEPAEPSPGECCNTSCATVTHHFRLPCWNYTRGGKTISVNTDVIIPVILVPVIIFTAAQGILWTVGTFMLLPICIFLFHVKCLRRQTGRSKFFFSWTISSLVFVLGVFELEVIPYLEILLSENLTLKALIIAVLASAYYVKVEPGQVLQNPSLNIPDVEKTPEQEANDCLLNMSEELKMNLTTKYCKQCGFEPGPRASHCKICNTCIMRRDHHCIWLDTCVGVKNHRAFIFLLTFLVLASFYGANLTLTTVCHPVMIWNNFLFPNDCTGVYDNIHIAICFVSAIYMLLIASAATACLFHQLWLISHNITALECYKSKHSNGNASNKKNYCGCPQSSNNEHGAMQNWRNFCLGNGLQ